MRTNKVKEEHKHGDQVISALKGRKALLGFVQALNCLLKHSIRLLETSSLKLWTRMCLAPWKKQTWPEYCRPNNGRKRPHRSISTQKRNDCTSYRRSGSWNSVRDRDAERMPFRTRDKADTSDDALPVLLGVRVQIDVGRFGRDTSDTHRDFCRNDKMNDFCCILDTKCGMISSWEPSSFLEDMCFVVKPLYQKVWVVLNFHFSLQYDRCGREV